MSDQEIIRRETGKTRAVPFVHVRSADCHILEVREGVGVQEAISTAELLDVCVMDVMSQAISGGSMDANTVYLCRFAMQASSALRTAAGVVA
jgi:hypothetical protein